VADERSDDPGVLGNLPRSRPGRRSAKRSSSSAAKGGARTTRAKTGGASPKARASAAKQRTRRSTTTTGARGKRSGASTAGSARRPQSAIRNPQSTDPLTQAVRLAGKVTELGVRTGVGVLKRLTRR
jgi:hypothetical protein